MSDYNRNYIVLWKDVYWELDERETTWLSKHKLSPDEARNKWMMWNVYYYADDAKLRKKYIKCINSELYNK